LANETAGSVAAVSYAVLSASPSVLGLAAHATHFVMLPGVAGAFLLLGPQSSKRLLASGLLFGVGLLMKQPACKAEYPVREVDRRKRILLRRVRAEFQEVES